MTFTKEEIRVLKKIAIAELRMEKIFLEDENGTPIPKGNYDDWVKAVRGDK